MIVLTMETYFKADVGATERILGSRISPIKYRIYQWFTTSVPRDRLGVSSHTCILYKGLAIIIASSEVSEVDMIVKCVSVPRKLVLYNSVP